MVEKILEATYYLAAPPVKEAILNKIREKQLVATLPFLSRIKNKSELPEMNILIEETIISLKTAEDYTFELMKELAGSNDAGERLRAARLLGSSGRYATFRLLVNLLKDPDPEIVKAAILSCGKIKRFELWPYIIERLIVPEFSNSAAIAIKKIGEPILADVDRLFEKISGHKAAQLKIITIYESIGSPRAIKFLRDKINHPDKDIRYRVLLALSNIEYHASALEISFIKDTIEESAENIVWILASLNDLAGAKNAGDLQLALLQELEEKKEHVFLLLSLLYDSKTIRHIRENIESKDINAKIYALEIGDMMISDEIKELFFPIFEDLPVHERLSRFSLRFPQEKMNLEERLHDIVNKSYSYSNRWTKACAISALSVEIPDDNLTEELLAANLVNSDPLLSELAAWGLFNRNRGYYFDTLIMFDKKDREKITGIVEKIKSFERNSDKLLFQKVMLLKNNELFSTLPENEITHLLLNLEDAAKYIDQADGSAIDKPADKFSVSFDDGFTITIPRERLYELMTGDFVFAERYFRIFNKTMSK